MSRTRTSFRVSLGEQRGGQTAVACSPAERGRTVQTAAPQCAEASCCAATSTDHLGTQATPQLTTAAPGNTYGHGPF